MTVSKFPRMKQRRTAPAELFGRAAAAAKRREVEDVLAYHIRRWGLPEPQREVRFHETRRWRFDFAWPDFKLAAEVEGGNWSGGRHTRGKGFESDAEKYAEATMLGWTVLRFTTTQVRAGYAIRVLEDVLSKRRLP